MYRLHKVAYWKHVPPHRSTLLVIFMVCVYLTSPEAVRFLLSSSYLNATARATSIWGREVMAALWDEYPPCLMCIQVMSQKKEEVFQPCVHIQKSGARHAHTLPHWTLNTRSHPFILTHMHTGNWWIVTLGSGVMLKLSLRNSKMQYSLIAKQMSLSYMLKPMLLKVCNLVISSK